MIHWSWIILAGIEMQFRRHVFDSPFWNAAELLAVFGIVLLHEIGHVTSCRQVGGTADRIVLLPFGGVAVIRPPQRPWPVFWSAAGGPLMNIALVPATILIYYFCEWQGWTDNKNVNQFLLMMTIGNIFLLFLNLLPLYPMDGGQMLYAVLWAIFGRAPGLMIASAIGLVGGCLFGLLCVLVVVMSQDPGFLVLAVFSAFMVIRCIASFAQAWHLTRLLGGPRHTDARCPSCHAQPIQGRHWVCDQCRSRFDTFETLAECPRCYKRFDETACPECGQKNTIIAWFPRAVAPSAPAPATTETPFRPHEEWDQEMPREYN
jgi:Zn-dependent protease